MIRFAKSHIRVLSSVAILSAIVCAAYLPLWKAWPDVVPSVFRGLFIVISMPWSWAAMSMIDPVLWGASRQLNYVVPELIIALGFGLNVALITAAVWFALRRGATTEVHAGQ